MRKKKKHTIRDVLITLLSWSGIVYCYRAYMRRRGPLVRVLCFHDVPDAAWFESVMAQLTAHYTIITPEAFHRQEFDSERINVLLTFDDGYRSWVDVVLPVLSQHDARAVFFITSGLLDAAEESEAAAARFVRERLALTRPRRTLTWDGARALVAAGHTIGGHTYTHANLAQCDAAEVQKEVCTDRAKLEDELGVTLRDFAYPFGRRGDMRREAEAVLRDVGYAHVYSAETGFAHNRADTIPRTLVERTQSPRTLRRWVEGGYDVFQKLVWYDA